MFKKKYIKELVLFLVLTISMFPMLVYAVGEADKQVEIKFRKTWDDADNQDGKRPCAINVDLYKYSGDSFDETSAVKLGSGTVYEKDGWEYTFRVSESELMTGGELAQLKVVEVLGGDTGDYYQEISHTDPELSRVPAVFDDTWKSETPCSELIRDHTGSGSQAVVAKKGNYYVFWTPEALTESEKRAVFDSASKGITGFGQGNYDNAVFIYGEGESAYGITVTADKITFDVPKDWSFFGLGTYTPASINAGLAVITNKHVPETVSVSVNKVWEDGDNQDGLRPGSITVKLIADGASQPVDTAVLSSDNKWSYEFKNLPKYNAGREIVYTIEEVEVEGYDTEISGNAKDGFEIKNTHTPEVINIIGKKVWTDNDDQDGKRPDTITIELYANGVLKDTTTASETTGWMYGFAGLPKFKDGEEIQYTIKEVKVDEYKEPVITGDADSGFVIENVHEPEKRSIKAVKEWDDDSNRDGIRPKEIIIYLKKNGEPVRQAKLSEENNWSYEFTDLDKYSNGQIIKYIVTEKEIDGYKSVIDGNLDDGFKIINRHTPQLVEVSGEKYWDDNDNQDKKRPESITVTLYKNGEATDKVVKVTEVDSHWKYSFKDLPKYENGKEIMYTVVESQVSDYSPLYSDSGYDITNTYTPSKTSVNVSKSWDDDTNRDGIRPGSIRVQLEADGEPVKDGVIELNEENQWRGVFTDLPEYRNGEKIVYTIEEIEVDGYDTDISGSAEDGFVITNTHEPEVISISGKKTWDDNDNQDGKRPDSIIIELYANGEFDRSITVTKDDKWLFEFKDIPKYDEGKEITYTIKEVKVEGYDDPDIKGNVKDGFEITNTHKPEVISISGKKTWVDNDNQDGKRPDEIEIRLLVDGKKVDSTKATKDGGWTFEFKDIPKYDAGKEIVYTVDEVEVEGYKSIVKGSNDGSFEITNTHEPEIISISGKKIWDDNDNQDKKRPESITVTLYKNGEATDKVVEVIEENGKWKYSFNNLPKYENGNEIIYTVVENQVSDYSTSYSKENFDITNRYTPSKISVTVSKSWNDSDNIDGIRPKSVKVQLFADGEPVDDGILELNEKNKWRGVYADLPEYRNGERIEYSIEEQSVEGYTAKYAGDMHKGFEITNTHIAKTGGGNGDNQDGDYPITGDNNNIVFWLVLAVMAIAGSVAGAVSMKKHR